jgi:hypothetical protein
LDENVSVAVGDGVGVVGLTVGDEARVTGISVGVGRVRLGVAVFVDRGGSNVISTDVIAVVEGAGIE